MKKLTKLTSYANFNVIYRLCTFCKTSLLQKRVCQEKVVHVEKAADRRHWHISGVFLYLDTITLISLGCESVICQKG